MCGFAFGLAKASCTDCDVRVGYSMVGRAGDDDELFEVENDPGSYLAVGVSTCFVRDEEGKLTEV